MKDDSPVNTSDSRITVSSLTSTISKLQFNPLRTSDGGQYQCVATVMSGGNSANLTDEIDLNVTSKWNITSIIHHVYLHLLYTTHKHTLTYTHARMHTHMHTHAHTHMRAHT